MQAFKGKGIFLIFMLMITIFISMLAGCATFEKRIVQTLEITKAAQDAGGHSIAYLYNTGKISEDDWQNFKVHNDEFVMVWKEVLTGLDRYQATKTPGDKGKLEEALGGLVFIFQTVNNIVIELTKKAGK